MECKTEKDKYHIDKLTCRGTDYLDEMEDLISWNLSFGVQAKDTINRLRISDDEKSYLYNIYRDYIL